jgi:hypothetical protein
MSYIQTNTSGTIHLQRTCIIECKQQVGKTQQAMGKGHAQLLLAALQLTSILALVNLSYFYLSFTN